MKNWKCIIIDDEPHAIGILEEMIGKIPNLQVIKTYEDGLSALKDLNSDHKVDLIFSDIDMPGLGGIDAAKLLRPFCRYLIFTTGHSKYAVDAFNVHADGFLLKPINLLNLIEKITFLRATEGNKTIITGNNPPDHIFVKGSNKGTFIRIAYNDIVCIDSDDHFLNIITVSDKFMVYLTMKEMENYLEKRPEFLRISKSCIVSISHLQKVEGNRVFLMHKEEKTRDIGETYRKPLHNFLHNIAIMPSKKIHE